MADQGLVQWLDSIGLGQYGEVFSGNDIDFELLPDLTDEDFAAMGVSIGHRRRLRKALGGTAGAGTGSHSTPEHRQLTVMFCDLANSTRISEQLETEDYREVILAYQEYCRHAIDRFGGFIARYQGDGILVYFGYPSAHEDDAERAVYAALDLTGSITVLQSEIGNRFDIETNVRIGICTGPVVVGDLIGEGAAQEKAVLGEIPNVAARLQGLAEPGQVVIGPGTFDLVRDLFDTKDLGPHALKGISAPVTAHAVLAPKDVASRFEATAVQGLTELAGREGEINLILDRWQQCRLGETQVVALIAEAGIGKSRIVREIKDRLQPENPNRVLYFCSAHYQNTALYPVTEQLRRALGVRIGDPPELIMEELAGLLDTLGHDDSDALSLLAGALGLPADSYPELGLGPQQRRERLLNTMISIIETMSRQSPVLLVLEDLQWIDHSTNALMELLIARLTAARVLIVATARPGEIISWRNHPNVTLLTLNHLGLRHSRKLVDNLLGDRHLPPVIVEQILDKTDGVPLFLEELTKVVVNDLDSGDVSARDSAVRFVPSSLKDSLMARLDQLGEARELAQTAAVLGRQFDYALLDAVCDLDDSVLDRQLQQLQDRDILIRSGEPPNAVYHFKQALSQETAYGSLLRAARRQIHEKVADCLISKFEYLARAEPERVAYHLTETSRAADAITWWHRAARDAYARSANQEAINHLEQGLELLRRVSDDDERRRLELDLRLTLGGALGTIKGWASKEVGENYFTARELCREFGTVLEQFTVEWGLWLYHQQGGRMREAKELAAEILELSKSLPDSDYHLQAHHAAWTTAERTADFESCLKNAQQGLALYDKEQHRHHAYLFGGHDPGACAAQHLACSQSEMGLLDQAVTNINRSKQIAKNVSDPLSQAMAMFYATKIHQSRGEAGECLRLADEIISISDEYGFPLVSAQGKIMRGWAIAEDTDLERGVAIMVEGLNAIELTGSRVRRPYFMTLLASLYQEAGRMDEARQTIEAARDALEMSGEITNEVDLIRVEGEIAANSGDAETGESRLLKAVGLARERSALMSELRAATSLAAIYAGRGEGQRARAVLQPVMDRIVEGLDTRDPVKARTLLRQISGSSMS